MIKVIFVRGMQASGKSTWAKQFVKENQDYKRVSRDDLRHMLSSYTFNNKNEKLVTELERSIIHIVLGEGYNLILDKMNLNPKDFEDDKQYLMRVGALNNINIEFEVKDFPVTLNEALERDRKREPRIGENVLISTWNRHQEELTRMLNVNKPEYDNQLPDCIICDIDGTLADRGSRNAYDFKKVKEDTVKEQVRDLVVMLKCYRNVESSWPKLIIFSGRDDSCMKDTIEWLEKHNVPYNHLYMRKTGDKRKDAIVKKELYEAHVKNKYNCLYWVDDRRQVIDMVRNELGLCCLDVAGHDF